NILVGGGRVAERPVLVNNYSYSPPAKKGGLACNLAYGKGTLKAVVKDNYFVSGGRSFALKGEAAQVAGNVFVGPTEGLDKAAFPDNTVQTAAPKGTRVFVRPNQYEPGRAHLCVFNWDNA